MLQPQAVDAKLLELLNSLMQLDQFKHLVLVGETALALQIGHRKSIDIDLFGKHDLSDLEISGLLSEFGAFQNLGGSESIKICLVNGVKVDIVNYPYDWLKPVLSVENIRLASLEDIAAMKIAAITQRGSKKDFIDLFFLLRSFSLKEIMDFYNEKIKDGNLWMALKSLSYFNDAEEEPMPLMLQQFSWKEVKENILKEVRKFDN